MKTHINLNRLWGKTKAGFLIIPVMNLLAMTPLAASALESRDPLLLSVMKQTTLTGRIVDSKGSALAGVEVKNLTTGQALSSGADGSYTIAGNKSDKLQFRLIGFVSQILNAGSASLVTLVSSMEELDEVVVVGYGTQKKVNLTGAVSSVQFNE